MYLFAPLCLTYLSLQVIKKAAKKYFFSDPATKKGGGGKGLATKKKYLFEAIKKSEKYCGH